MSSEPSGQQWPGPLPTALGGPAPLGLPRLPTNERSADAAGAPPEPVSLALARGTAAAKPVSIPRWTLLVLAVLAQVALALATNAAPWLGALQAATILLLGVYATLRHNLVLLTCLCGYLTGAEVLWRQVQAPMFYLVAPYLMIVLSCLVIAVVLGRLGRDARLAAFYVLLLLPSIVNTVRTAGEGSRELIAFALAGPLALAAFVAFTSQVVATPVAYRRILWVTLVSAVGPLTIAVTDIRSVLGERGSVEFTGQSNFLTSGGFGPVQVSAVMGLGVLVAVILTIIEPSRSVKILTVVVGIAFSVQSLLTFSRGGMSAVAIAVSALAIARARDPRIRNRIIALVAVALAIGYFFIVPWLTDFTDGEFEERFSDTTSGRTDLAINDMRIFAESPVFGVGPGMTKYQRLTYNICELRSDGCANEASSHTEFTRMLSEHGLPGLVAVGALALLAVRGVRDAAKDRPFAAAFIAWAVAQMFYANLRVVAVPFAFGLAFLTVRSPRGPDDAEGDGTLDDRVAPSAS